MEPYRIARSLAAASVVLIGLLAVHHGLSSQTPSGSMIGQIPPTERIPTRAPSATPLPSDPRAIELLRRSDEAMNMLKTAHVERTRTDRAFGTVYDYQAPDRARQDVYRDGSLESSAVWIGTDLWERTGEERWTKASWWSGLYQWPKYRRADPDSSSVGPPAHARIDEGELDEQVWKLSYERSKPSIEGWFTEYRTEWIDKETNRILRAVVFNDDPWGEPGSVLEVTYSAFDEPVGIPFPTKLLFPWAVQGHAPSGSRAQ